MKAFDMFLGALFFFFRAIIFAVFCTLCSLPFWAILAATSWLFNISWQWSWVVASGIIFAIFLLWWGPRSLRKSEAKYKAQEEIDNFLAKLAKSGLNIAKRPMRGRGYTIFLKSPSRFYN